MKTATTISRTADANWKGNIQGYGIVSTQSGTLRDERFSLPCRIDDSDRSEVNPEELIAAAAASCFSMALSKTLTDRAKVPTELVVIGTVDLTVDDNGPTLTKLRLLCDGLVPAASKSEFEDAVKATQETCPVFQLLKPGFKEVEVEARLEP